MAVATTTVLPGQPGDGVTVYHPLGGNGYDAPNAAYSVLTDLTMDASGGLAVARTNFDEKFSAILVNIDCLVTGLTAAQEFEVSLVQRPTGSGFASGTRMRGHGTGIFTDTVGDRVLYQWSPPLLIDQDHVICSCPNIDTGVLHTMCYIYLFNIRVFELVPLHTILASIPSRQSQNVVT